MFFSYFKEIMVPKCSNELVWKDKKILKHLLTFLFFYIKVLEILELVWIGESVSIMPI